MTAEIGDVGYLRIGNAEDRAAVAEILYKNGYTVSPARKKKGKSFEYYVRYEIRDMEEE